MLHTAWNLNLCSLWEHHSQEMLSNLGWIEYDRTCERNFGVTDIRHLQDIVTPTFVDHHVSAPMFWHLRCAFEFKCYGLSVFGLEFSLLPNALGGRIWTQSVAFTNNAGEFNTGTKRPTVIHSARFCPSWSWLLLVMKQHAGQRTSQGLVYFAGHLACKGRL